MYPDRDFDLQAKGPWHEQALIQDLELDTLLDAMALGDAFLRQVAGRAILSSLTDPEVIRYRQEILKDCLRNPSIVREVYALTLDAIEGEKKVYWGLFHKYPDMILHRALEVMQLFVGMLKRLRGIADQHAPLFQSKGFATLFAMLEQELSDEYFATVERHLRELRFRNGVLISAELGKGNKGTNYTLCQPAENRQGLLGRLRPRRAPAYSFAIADRDESGARALAELKDRGINLVANALAQSADHILGFFTMLRTELAFYVGCLNLYDRLTQLGEPVCFPEPAAPGTGKRSFVGLYDPCLALTMKGRVVGNDLEADHKDLVVITGANQGGKSTFLRSVGLAQLMMQAGMFVAAESFSASACDGLYTHYKREEDATLRSGKLDEELSRMSDIADHITAHSMVLFNESFAATNEREGSEIARQIVLALLEEGIQVFFVTHLYEFAHALHRKKMGNALFLRAEREADGRRTFRIREGAPLQTSHGADLYEKVFGPDGR